MQPRNLMVRGSAPYTHAVLGWLIFGALVLACGGRVDRADTGQPTTSSGDTESRPDDSVSPAPPSGFVPVQQPPPNPLRSAAEVKALCEKAPSLSARLEPTDTQDLTKLFTGWFVACGGGSDVKQLAPIFFEDPPPALVGIAVEGSRVFTIEEREPGSYVSPRCLDCEPLTTWSMVDRKTLRLGVGDAAPTFAVQTSASREIVFLDSSSGPVVLVRL